MRFSSTLLAVLMAGTAVFSQADLLNRPVRQTQVDGKTLIETARLLEAASGVRVTIDPDLRACVASGRRGCDWRIHTTWTGQTLEAALDTLCGSAKLTYRVVDEGIVITRRPPSRQ